MRIPFWGRSALGLLVVVAIAASGLLAVTTVTAEAHQGSIRVESAVCVDANTIEATYRWSWANAPRASFGTRVVRKTGTTRFEGSWGGQGGAALTTVGTASGVVTWTVTLHRSQFNGGNGPWEYVYAPWSDGYAGSRYNDTRVENVDWNRCAPAATRDAAASLTTTPPSCADAERLVLGRTVHATWGTPTRTTGPGSYSVTATAAPGHLFADGQRTRTFTGALAGRLAGRECAGPAPRGDVESRPVTGTPDCAPRTVTSWTEERTRSYDWSDVEHRYLPGDWTPWAKVPGSESTLPATSAQCPPGPPLRQPVEVRGSVRKIDKCGRNDFFRVAPVRGGVYRVKGQVVRQGVWLKARTKVVRITLTAASGGYRIVGARTFTLRFPKTRPCAKPPVTSPKTGA